MGELAPINNIRERSLMTLSDIESLEKLSVILFKSGNLPKGVNKPEAVFAMLLAGYEAGLAPMQSMSSIMIMGGRPSIYGDAMLALVRASGLLKAFEEGIEGEGDERYAWCNSSRVGGGERVTTFSVADAKRANLWGKPGPWSEYTERQMMFRARSFNLRDQFGDVLRGLVAVEEARDYPGEIVVTVNAEKPSTEPKMLEAKAEPTPVAVEMVTREQLAEFKKLQGMLFVNEGGGDAAKQKVAWLKRVQGMFPGVQSVKELSQTDAADLIEHLQTTIIPF